MTVNTLNSAASQHYGTMSERPHDGGRRVPAVFALAIGLSVAVAVSADLGGAGAAPASLAVALAVTGGSTDLRRLAGAIATGAVALATVGWLGAAAVLPDVSSPLAAGLGVAVGGGLGAVVWLLAAGDDADRGPGTVDVDMGADADPAPQPADLFAASPDPIVFFVDRGDGPVVRALNPAFEESFGTDAAALEDAPLAEALPAGADAEAVLAGGDGAAHDAVYDCETVDGTRPMRLRVAVTGEGASAGYLLYSAVAEGAA